MAQWPHKFKECGKKNIPEVLEALGKLYRRQRGYGAQLEVAANSLESSPDKKNLLLTKALKKDRWEY